MPKEKKKLKIKIKIITFNKRLSSRLTSLNSTFTFNSSSKSQSLYQPIQAEPSSTLDLLEIKNPINLDLRTLKPTAKPEVIDLINISIPINIHPKTDSINLNPFCPISKPSSKKILRRRFVSLPPKLTTIFEDQLKEKEEEERNTCFVEIKIINRSSTYTYHSIYEPSKTHKGSYRPGSEFIQLRGTPSKPYPHLTGVLNPPKRKYKSSPFMIKHRSRYSS
ncbi:uncharacterized protein MELLADRAFT_101135 [Melampsora larici-populina 98AG31]|uniref:Uncharacterized protein n=1 Tax=Melampsora larici-populina (strain 98AG31 / pathotype 3-4-7) TaxID=747676 RepID=F4R3R1_MELLP|nr:uncharacterized protein MELLADRAFT_101135 [Melampsora larici-populina 98AG31]EGG12672.1 hypothetical protein MELLADRAFT_101135 [Melampsora larici-populina 98AG31]